MKTESILKQLDSIFSKVDDFSQEELDTISSVNISRLSFTDDILYVDFSDLDNFNNLTQITIDSCVIDKNAMEHIIKHVNLQKLSLYNCDVSSDAYSLFKKIQVRKLYFINTDIDLSLVPGYYDLVYVENVPINDIASHGEVLDVSKTNVSDIDVVITSSFKNIVFSKKQYYEHQYLIDNCCKKFVVMEENAQFVSKEVTA